MAYSQSLNQPIGIVIATLDSDGQLSEDVSDGAVRYTTWGRLITLDTQILRVSGAGNVTREIQPSFRIPFDSRMLLVPPSYITLTDGYGINYAIERVSLPLDLGNRRYVDIQTDFIRFYGTVPAPVPDPDPDPMPDPDPPPPTLELLGFGAPTIDSNTLIWSTIGTSGTIDIALGTINDILLTPAQGLLVMTNERPYRAWCGTGNIVTDDGAPGSVNLVLRGQDPNDTAFEFDHVTRLHPSIDATPFRLRITDGNVQSGSRREYRLWLRIQDASRDMTVTYDDSNPFYMAMFPQDPY